MTQPIGGRCRQWRRQWAQRGGEWQGRVQLPTCDIDLHLARAGADGVGGLTDVGSCQAVVDRSPEEESSVLGLHTLGEGAIQPAGIGRQGRGLRLSSPEKLPLCHPPDFNTISPLAEFIGSICLGRGKNNQKQQSSFSVSHLLITALTCGRDR